MEMCEVSLTRSLGYGSYIFVVQGYWSPWPRLLLWGYIQMMTFERTTFEMNSTSN